VLDLGALVQNNLGWGWKNVSYINPPSGAQFICSSQIYIDPTVPAPGNTYMIWTTPVKYVGWRRQSSCRQRASKGQGITFGPSPVKVTQEGQVIGVLVTLNPGFSASLSLTMYSNGNTPVSGANAQIICSYQTTTANVLEAHSRGLIDTALSEIVYESFAESMSVNDIPITHLVGLGAYSWTVK